MTPLLRRGRAIVGAIAVTHVALAIGTILLVLIMGRFELLPRLSAKFLATASTAYGLWQGSRWAKWLYVLGFAVGAGFLLYFAATMPPAVMWLPGSGGVLFGVLAGLLALTLRRRVVGEIGSRGRSCGGLVLRTGVIRSDIVINV
jgi:hypothetical protein